MDSMETAPAPLQVAALYRHDCEGYGQCPPRWTAFKSFEEEDTDREARMAEMPIVHRHAFEDKKWETLSFTINDVHMQNLLSRAFEGYQGLDMKLEHWTFQPPYRPLVHRWTELNHLHDEIMADDDAQAEEKQAAQVLLDFLRPIMTPSIEALSQTRDTGMIYFDDVWKIFPPSELIVSKASGVPFVYRVLTYKLRKTYLETYWKLTVQYVDWDGSRCGYLEKTLHIPFFHGLSHVHSLDAYPLAFHKEPEVLRESLVERGRKFERLRGYYLQNYKGKMLGLTGGERGQERAVNGRVIIDAFAYYFSRNKVRPPLRSLDDEGVVHEFEYKRQNSRSSSRARSRESSVSPPQTRASSPSLADAPLQLSRVGDVYGRDEEKTPLTDEQRMMADPRLIGFDLESKQWGEFIIDDLAEVEWNYSAFEHLVLPEDDKQLAWDFVQCKASSTGEFDDYIKDKGRGLVLLMFGPPGVGKTFTAEAVAEQANVPLYAMSASMLGSEPTEIAQNLDRALTLCKLWNAMLLLDEADVFMSARSNDHIQRNELVSIFLTKIEYYPGILFLTTNRASEIDFAFQSRVDLFLPYHDLPPEARRQIWSNFIERAGRERFTPTSGDMETDLDRLSQLALNGREIKNLVKTSQLLSQKTGGVGSMERLYLLAEKRVKALTLLAERGN